MDVPTLGNIWMADLMVKEYVDDLVVKERGGLPTVQSCMMDSQWALVDFIGA